jgi:hypothetical protein
MPVQERYNGIRVERLDRLLDATEAGDLARFQDLMRALLLDGFSPRVVEDALEDLKRDRQQRRRRRRQQRREDQAVAEALEAAGVTPDDAEPAEIAATAEAVEDAAAAVEEDQDQGGRGRRNRGRAGRGEGDRVGLLDYLGTVAEERTERIQARQGARTAEARAEGRRNRRARRGAGGGGGGALDALPPVSAAAPAGGMDWLPLAALAGAAFFLLRK